MLATCRRWLGAGQLRLVELLGAISLATDLGTGQPPFHGVRTSVLAVAVTRELGLDDAAVAEVQQVALLQFVGCAADTWQTARMTGGDDLAFLAAMAPAAMGAKAEMARSLVGAVGAGRPRCAGRPWRQVPFLIRGAPGGRCRRTARWRPCSPGASAPGLR